MASYNEIIKLLSDFATAHYQIKAFGNGEMAELVETFSLKDAEYPKMWANDQPNTTAKGEEVFKFRVYVVDQVATLKQKTDTTLGESNINEVKSNMRQVCLDLVSFLIQNTTYSEITTDRNILLTSFVDSFNDKLTGWYFDLNIRQALSFSACIIPMDGILPPPIACKPAIITINGDEFITVPSGVTENILVKDTDGTEVGSKIGDEWIVPAGGGGDATDNIFDSEFNLLYSNVIPAGDINIQTITDGINTFNGSSIAGILAQGTKEVIVQTMDAIPVQVGNILVNTKNQLIIEVDAIPPPPPTGAFISLSWTGSRITEYDFDITSAESCNYNTISRKAGAQTWDNAIFSNETMSSDDNWSISGDNDIASGGVAYMIGFGLKSDTGLNFADIDFALFNNSTNITWYESGVSGGVVATIPIGKLWSWRFEHISSTNTVQLYINNVLVKTASTSYSSDTLAVKLDCLTQSIKLSNHIALINTATPNMFLGAIGDSITFGRASQGLKSSNYIEQTLIGLGNTYYTNPILALNNYTTSLVLANIMPLVPATYDATRTKNVYSLMIGINDLRASVPAATIIANITTIVTSLQSTGFEVVLHTISRDFTNDWADRYVVNADIISNTMGADYIADHTGQPIETDTAYYEVDLIHYNPAGMQMVADTLTPIVQSI